MSIPATVFYTPPASFIGAGCLPEAAQTAAKRGFKHALLVTDAFLSSSGMAQKIGHVLRENGIAHTVFDGVKPNPTLTNVHNGLDLLRQHGCDCLVSLGGGSSHDCAKAIALLAANGGTLADYDASTKGLNVSQKPQLPLMAINTTAGTGSEVTRASVITDETRRIKMTVVDHHIVPLISVNDPQLMMGMPAALTAATGMDALTHAVESYVSVLANPMTDAWGIKAIELIAAHLRTAVADGSNQEAREGMAWAQFMAGLAFNNASLGYVHSMAHQLGGHYDLPHGVCNAILLPHVEAFNTPACAARLRDVAHALGEDVRGMDDTQAAAAAISAIRRLAQDVGIPAGWGALGGKREDIPLLAKNALLDGCSFTNPRQATPQEIETLFEAAF